MSSRDKSSNLALFFTITEAQKQITTHHQLLITANTNLCTDAAESNLTYYYSSKNVLPPRTQHQNYVMINRLNETLVGHSSYLLFD